MVVGPAQPHAVVTIQSARAEERAMVARLIANGRQDLPLLKSEVLSRGLSDEELPEALSYVNAHADRSSYHLLFAIRRASPSAYQNLGSSAKAAILCDALSHVQFLNDWGYLDPSESHDGEASVALLELGRDALGSLAPVLSNGSPAPLYGSETATLSSTYKFRRQDFAYRYVMLILRRLPTFDADPSVRDGQIARLRTELSGKP